VARHRGLGKTGQGRVGDRPGVEQAVGGAGQARTENHRDLSALGVELVTDGPGGGEHAVVQAGG
jgi:hypothetical protein